MKVTELNEGQKLQLKQRYLMIKNGQTSWQELANANSLVSDKELIEHYSSYVFNEDDFSYIDERSAYSY